MIRFVLLDLDDTILDFCAAEHAALRGALTSLSVPAGEAVLARYSVINGEHWKRLERGEITRAELKTARFRELFRELGVTAPADEAAHRYEALLGGEAPLLPGAAEVLPALAARYRLFAVTNGTAATQRRRIAGADLARFFEQIFISEEVGAPKPERAYFEACFAIIPGFCRAEAVIVGDSLTSDIAGGVCAGIRTVWFNPAHAPTPGAPRVDAQFAALLELPALLEGM